MTVQRIYPDRESRDRLQSEAQRLAVGRKYAPLCSVCSRRMRMDNFNGMWCCSGDYAGGNHGGYQTRDQVQQLIYVELCEQAGYLA